MEPAGKKVALPSGPEPLTALQMRRGLERSCARTRGLPFSCMQTWASKLGLTLVPTAFFYVGPGKNVLSKAVT